MDRPRSSDGAGINSADWRRCVLCTGEVEQVCAAGRDRISRAELAGGFAGWDAGAGPAASASTLRILCGSHGRYLWSPRAHGRAGVVGLYASLDCDGAAGCVSYAVDPVVSGDTRAGRVSA